MSQIPETIRNAIEVVKLLGERYLWVDTLCISQDDKETKSREIDSMAAIYANAILTIVAAEGGNSDYGLRGLKEISQQRDIDMDTLVVDFGEEYKLINVDVGDGRGKWASSPYFTRGWVFQEYHFSKRRLIFQNQMIRWECSCDNWQEPIIPVDNFKSPYSHTFEAALGRRHPTLVECCRVFGDYNVREFTYTEDALPAITGLFAILGHKYLGSFIFGLPEMFFDAALNWDRRYQASWGDLTRRVSNTIQVGVSQSCLPSWSWIGWKGRFNGWETDDDFNHFTVCPAWVYTIPITKWYTSARLGGPMRQIDSWFLRDRDRFKNHLNEPMPPGWTRDTKEGLPDHSNGTRQLPPEGGGEVTYRHESCPNLQFWYPFPLPIPGKPAISPPQTPYLFCDTHRLFLKVKSPLPETESFSWTARRPTAHLYTDAGIFAGVLLCQNALDHVDLMAKEDMGEKVEMAAISRGFVKRTSTGPRDGDATTRYFKVPYNAVESRDGEQEGRTGTMKLVHMKEWYNILWIEWEDGIAYRRCLGRILKHVWEAQKLEPISLVLG